MTLTLCEIKQQSPVTFLFTPACTCPVLVNNLAWKKMPKIKQGREDGGNCSISLIIYSLYYTFIILCFSIIYVFLNAT